MEASKGFSTSNLLLNNSIQTNSHEEGNGQPATVNSLVDCGLCLDTYKDPRLLSCGHSFCLKCLQKQMDTSNKAASLTCGLCRRPWVPPIDGLEQLPKNTLAESFIASLPSVSECVMADDGSEHGRVEHVCVDCWEVLCFGCSRVHKKTTLTREHTVKRIAEITQSDIDKHRQQQPTVMCATHKNQELVLYCDKCFVVVCTVCYAASHSKHSCVELSRADDIFIDTIRKSVSEGKAAEKKLHVRLEQIDKLLKALEDQQKTLMKDAKSRVTEVRNKIQTAYEMLMAELDKCELKTLQEVACKVDHERQKLTKSMHGAEEKLKKIHHFVSSYEKYLPPASSAAERATFAKQLRHTMDAVVKEISSQNDVSKCHVANADEWNCDVSFTTKWREIVPSTASFCSAFTVMQLKAWYSAGIMSQHADKILASCLLAPELHIYGMDGQHMRTLNVPAKIKDAAWTLDGKIVYTTNDTNAVVIMTEGGDIIKETQMASPWCVDVSREGVIYLADYNNGAYQSVDGGMSWKHLFKPPDGWNLWQVINVHTDHGDVLWALEDGAGSGGSRRLREYPAPDSSKLGVNGMTSRRGSNISNSESDKDLDLECSFLWGCSRLAYDGDGSIFFADCKNNVIHLFAANGAQRQRKLLTQSDGINRPRGLAVDRERRMLYVGQSEGDVRVFLLGDGKKSYLLQVDF